MIPPAAATPRPPLVHHDERTGRAVEIKVRKWRGRCNGPEIGYQTRQIATATDLTH
jgi:hypothetical protein